MRRMALPAIAFLALAGVIGFLVTQPPEGKFSTTSAFSSSTEPQELAEQQRSAGQAVMEEVSADSAGAMPATTDSLAGIGEVPSVGQKIIKTADLSLVVENNTFHEAFDKASLVAQKYNGFVVSSSSEGIKADSGSLLIRIPSDSFDLALGDLRDLGDVERQTIGGQDVTDQFVDLRARLKTWEAQEAVLIRLMGRARNVSQTMQIQRELQDVRFRIEEIKGQLRLLNDQASLATIAVSVRETGAAVAGKDPRKPSLGEAWSQAIAGFLGVIYAVVVGLGYLIPLAAVAAIGWFGYRKVRAHTA
ncbi:MAG: DUF4349 domain-containing protein [Actinomycetota bacterium]